ncbi:MAG: TspO/MBR family protein [Patescibacteria group bacterium]
MKWNYFFIPGLVAGTSLLGSWFTGQRMDWYKTLNLPSWTPPGSVIGTVWTVIFILTAVAIILIWNKVERDKKFWWIIAALITNGILNLGWSFLFFYSGLIGVAFWEAVLLDASVLLLIIWIWPRHRIASLLFLPYFLWVAFASYLNYIIWTLN